MSPEDAEAALRAARSAGPTVAPFTDAQPALGEQWGSTVQTVDRAHRVGQGVRVSGAKLGLTSATEQQRRNVDQPRMEPDTAFVTATGFSTRATRVQRTER